MKHLNRFNENNIEYKDIQEQIDEVLDNLSKKGKLSKSEKSFMDDASNGKVIEVSIPKSSGNFWSDMSNPHNSSIMWNNGKVWQSLQTFEDEEDDRLVKLETSDQTWERRRLVEIRKYFEHNPGLKEDLMKLLEMKKSVTKFAEQVNKKYKSKGEGSYNFNQRLDYATEGSLDTLIELFGFHDLDIDDDFLSKQIVDYKKG